MRATMMLLLIRTTGIAAATRRVHGPTAFRDIPTRGITTVIAMTALANDMLKTLSHIAQSCLAQVLQRFANVLSTFGR